MSRVPLLLSSLVLLFSYNDNAGADAYQDCLNRVTQEHMQSIKSQCWSKAEGPGGVISDGSQETQKAIECEKGAESSFRMDDSVAMRCMKEADAEEINPGKNSDKIPNVKIANISTPKVRPDTASATKPAAKPYTTTTPTAKKPVNTNPSGSGVTPESPDRAQSYASMDIEACYDARTEASRCCNNPMSCSSSLSYADQMSLQSLNQQVANGPKQGQSIAEYCSQMRQASASSGSVNNGLSSICYSNQSSCTSTCSGLVQKYQALLDNCDGCDSEDVYASTLASLQAANGTCRGLRANMNAMAQQGIGSSSGQAYGSICQQQASYNPGWDTPSSSNPNNSALNDMYGCAQNPQSAACRSCAMNPNSDACKALQQGQEAQKGKVGFQAANKKTDSSGFDTSSLDPSFADLNARMSTAANTAQQIENLNKGVPNNTGGAIPGQGANTQATLASAKAGTGTHAQEGTDTDIMRGHLSGGYSQGSGFEPLMRSGALPSRTLASVGTIPRAMQRMDLKKYLPGAGLESGHIGLNGRNPEINGKGADLFKKVSNKLEERCKLGMLRDCNS